MSETYNCIPSLTDVLAEAWSKSTLWIHSGFSKRSRSENGRSSSSSSSSSSSRRRRKRRSSGGFSDGAGDGSSHQTSHHDKASAKSLRTISSASGARTGNITQPSMTIARNSNTGHLGNLDASSTNIDANEHRKARMPPRNIPSRKSSLRGPLWPVVARGQATPLAKSTTSSSSPPDAGAGIGTGRHLQTVQSRDTIRLPVMHHNPALDFERVRATAAGQDRSQQSTPEQDEWVRSYHQQWARGYRQQWSAGYMDPLRDGVYHWDQDYDSERDSRYPDHLRKGRSFKIPIGQAF